LGVPLGIVLGYAGTAAIVSLDWRYAFWGQSALLICLFVIFLSYPTKYYIEKSKLQEKMEQLGKGSKSISGSEIEQKEHLI
jgi:predicted MFS family arabinose efflux permease